MLGVLLVLTFVAVGIASAPPLTFTFSDVHATKTATETDSYAVNDAGVIAGDYVDSSSVQHAMILAGTKLTTVNNSSCQSTGGLTGSIAFFGINSAGTAVGWCINIKTNLDESFTYSKGKFTPISFPKSNGTQATGINDTGEIVGEYLDSSGNAHGFLLAKSKYTAINVKGAAQTVAYGINNAGDIAAYSGSTISAGTVVCPCVGYIVKGTKFTKVSDPNAGTDGTVAHATNNKGQVVGTYYDSAGDVHGWLLDGGKYYELNDPTGCKCDTRGDGVNDTREIVGRYSTTLGGASIGFKATTK